MNEIIITIIIVLGIIVITGLICYTNYKLSNNKSFERLYNLINSQSIDISIIKGNQDKHSENIKYLENITGDINTKLNKTEEQLKVVNQRLNAQSENICKSLDNICDKIK